MDHPKTEAVQTSPRLACYIRLSSDEHARLKQDSIRLRKTPPELLKSAYFTDEPRTVLMTDTDRDYFFAQFHRIGNNVNQIAKQLNAGFAFGFHQELESVRSQLSMLTTWINAKYRSQKN